MNRKNFVFKTLGSIASSIPLRLLKTLSGVNMIYPTYHTVAEHPIPHIHNLYSPKSRKAFIRDLDFLLQHFQPIDYQEFKKIIVQNKKDSKGYFLLTFDDGLSEFYDVIAPLLRAKGIPAIVFLNSAFIDNQALFYRYKVSLLIEEFLKTPSLLKATEVQHFFENCDGKDKTWQESLLQINYHNREKADQLARIIDLRFDDYLTQRKPYLTSEQIRQLIRQGFHFGAHSVDHPEYRFISLESQISQTKESIETIGKKFALDYRCFAFPHTDFGVKKDFFDYAEKHSLFEYSFGGAGIKKDSISTHIQRIPMEKNKMSSRKIIHSEYLYYLIKELFNKNNIHR